jgi:hypothetical protein
VRNLNRTLISQIAENLCSYGIYATSLDYLSRFQNFSLRQLYLFPLALDSKCYYAALTENQMSQKFPVNCRGRLPFLSLKFFSNRGTAFARDGWCAIAVPLCESNCSSNSRSVPSLRWLGSIFEGFHAFSVERNAPRGWMRRSSGSPSRKREATRRTPLALCYLAFE